MSRKRARKRGNKADIKPNGVIIYDPDVDPNGETACKMFKGKYPYFDSAIILLPDNGRDGYLLNGDGSKKAYVFN